MDGDCGEQGEDGRALRGGRGLHTRIAAAEARMRGGGRAADAEARWEKAQHGAQTMNAYSTILRSSIDIDIEIPVIFFSNSFYLI
jgi:hypothetical protein